MRADKKKNMQKVAEKLIENPHITLEEIARDKNISVGTAHNMKKELEKKWKKDDTIRIIVNDAKDRIKRFWQIMTRELEKLEKKSLNWEELDREDKKLLKEYVKDDLQRVTVFWGSVTDEWGGLKAVASILDDIID